MGYYGFIKYENGGYTLIIEYGSLNGAREILDKKESLTKEEVNKIIKNNSLNVTYFYNGIEVGILW